MAWFLVAGVTGLGVLLAALLLDGAVEGAPAADAGLGRVPGRELRSLPAAAAFVSLLGFTGALAQAEAGLGTGWSAAMGAVAGLLGARGVLRLVRAVRRGESAPASRGGDLLGLSGTVVAPIPPYGCGEVVLRVAGQPATYTARSSGPVPLGARVRVTASLSSTAVQVQPAD
ncbi:NfeD family protein [Streptacidiphilus sp. ASG 303]|uniref:NfeD family protein n=1 Tax=Streptacidiphilus sp. ASG 303 TaxID=2896847 RepID=UPI001E48BDA5|nr:NfeD family protein [Streptacidiphilus sp. ASG 303]MCD0484846.1 NfeD family protein [Streptacidiphilus sp. ASG 303]